MLPGLRASLADVPRWGLVAVLAAAWGCRGDDQSGAPTPTTTGIPRDVVCEWARVVYVTDGDTVRVAFDGRPGEEPVRYIGVDTPETLAPATPVQPFGPEATARNAQLVDGKRVCLERDLSERDRYGRLLRYAWLKDGRMVNEVLVLEGFAVTDTVPPDVKYVDRFTAAQAAAREAERGIWEVSE